MLKILESEGNQQLENDKFNRVDILVEDHKKRKIIIEIQNTRESDYLERLLFGASKTVIDNFELDKPYKEIHKVISISILYFNLGNGDDYIYKGETEFIGMNTGTPLLVKERIEKTDNYGKIEVKFIEKDVFPEYYLIRVEKYQNIVKKAIDEWVYMFKNNLIEANFTSKNIDKAANKLAKLNMTSDERKAYERYLEGVAWERDQIETAREEGIEKGIEKGMKQQQIQTILTGSENGISIPILSKMTGLLENEIRSILKENEFE